MWRAQADRRAGMAASWDQAFWPSIKPPCLRAAAYACASCSDTSIAIDELYSREFQVVDTDAGSAIVAVLNERKTGTTRFIVLEKHAGRYRITVRGPLDGEGFHRATWGSEVVDADEDGYQEVLFSGRDSRESRTQRRLILFVPNDRRTYSMLMTGETTPNGTPRIIWLANAAGTDAAAYRTALRKKARALVMIARNR